MDRPTKQFKESISSGTGNKSFSRRNIPSDTGNRSFSTGNIYSDTANIPSDTGNRSFGTANIPSDTGKKSFGTANIDLSRTMDKNKGGKSKDFRPNTTTSSRELSLPQTSLGESSRLHKSTEMQKSFSDHAGSIKWEEEDYLRKKISNTSEQIKKIDTTLKNMTGPFSTLRETKQYTELLEKKKS